MNSASSRTNQEYLRLNVEYALTSPQAGQNTHNLAVGLDAGVLNSAKVSEA
jgi:hypothetical protein